MNAAAQVAANPLVLRLIFSHLSPTDLKTVSLVSSLWRETSDDPQLWSWAVMRLTERNLLDVLSSTRLRAVRAALYDGTREDTDTVSESLKNISELLVNNNDDLILKYLKFVTFLESSSHNSTRLANILSRVEQVDLQELKLHAILHDFAFYDDVMRSIAGKS